MRSARRRASRAWSVGWWSCLLLATCARLAIPSHAQVVTAPHGGCAATPYPICVQQDGVTEGNAKAFNFTGAGVDCTFSGPDATFTCDFSGGGGGGTAVALDLADNGVNESAALTEIATTGDTNAIVTEPSANKLLIDVSKDWPVADLAQDITCTSCVSDAELLNSYSGVGACAGNQYVHTLNDNAAPTCSAITLAQLAATCTDAQVVGGTLAGTGLECQTDAGAANAFGIVDPSTGTTATADAAGDTLLLTGTAPVVVTGSDPDTITLSFDAASLTLGGDVTGPATATVVGDNSHAHDASTIAGLDISADTNLAVTAPITLTGDTVGVTAFGAATSGVVPACSGGVCGTTEFLREDGSWQVPGGGSGTVTSVDCVAPLTCTPDPIVGAGTIGITSGITDAMLSSNYSGVGACAANQWASTLNDNAAPTCTQPAFTNLSGSVTDAQVPDTITASNYLPLAGGTMTGDLTLSADANEGLVGGGLVDCDTEAQVLGWDTTTRKFVCTADAGAGGGMTSWTAAGDTGTPQTITDGNTFTLTGGVGVDTACAATDTCTATLDTTEVNSVTWGTGAAASVAITFDLTGADGVFTMNSAFPSVTTNQTGATNFSLVNTNATTGGAGLAMGTSGSGDLVLTYNGPTDDWTTGVDTSDANAYVLSSGGALGTNNVLRCTTAGACTFPDSDGVTMTGPLTLTGEATGCAEFTAGGVLNGTGAACGGGGGVSDGDKGDITVSGSGATWTLDGAIRASSTICAGTSDASATVETEIATATTAGKAYVLPSGCRVGLASPGAGNAAVDLPSGATIICEDQTAGFFAEQQRCVGGTYPGAACNTSADCLGSGTCTPELGGSSVNPCGGTECFAPTNGSTYTMLKDAGGGANISITGCSFWIGQADPYQRCTVGATPCRQELDAGAFVGFACEADAGGGTCIRVADCAGDCNGAPLPATGLGSIVPIDLNRTVGARLTRLRVNDHFEGPATVIVAANALIEDSNLAAEITNCTSPLPSGVPTSGCVAGIQAGVCCYGAAAGLATQTQPTVAVTEGIDAAYGATIVRSKVRGATWAVDVEDEPSQKARINAVDVIPLSSSGPGLSSAGVRGGSGLIVEGVRVLRPTSGLTGITITGAKSLALGNTIMGVAGAGHGIAVSGVDTAVAYNYIESGATTGIGITTTAAYVTIDGNVIASSANDLLAYGIKTTAGGTIISNNMIHRVHDASIWLNNGFYQRVTGNFSDLANTRPSATFKPVHILADQSGGSGNIIANNIASQGWRGITDVGAGSTLTNTLIAHNRFLALNGAAFALGGAGVHILENYVNNAPSSAPTLSCDTSCTGTGLRGALCRQDSDCTASGACASTFDCNPEPVGGYIGSPNLVGPGAHNAWVGNIVYNGATIQTKQCGGTGPTSPGALCETAGNTCAGGGTCTGGSEPLKTCAGGSEAGKLCCTGGGSQTCAGRVPIPLIRMAEYNTAQTHSNTTIQSNQFFPGTTAGMDKVALDMVTSGSQGNLTITASAFSGNLVDGGSAVTNYGVKFPTSGTVTDFLLTGNNFANLVDDVVNPKGTYGLISFAPAMAAMAADQTSTSTSLADVTALQFAIAASRTYRLYCHMIFNTAATTTGIGLAINGPAAPILVSGRIGICDQTADCLTAGASNYRELHVNAYNTDLTTTGVVATSGTNRGAVLEFIVVNGTTAGTLAVRFKSEVAASTVTLKAGSSCEVTQMAKGS